AFWWVRGSSVRVRSCPGGPMLTKSVRSVLCSTSLAFTVLLGGCGSIEHTIACDTGLNNNSNCTCGPCPVSPGPEFLYASSQSSNQVFGFSIDHNSGALGTAFSTPAP